MLARNSKSILRIFTRMMHRKKKCPDPCGPCKVDKVTICGAASPLGQTLALLLKQTDLIREVHLYDEANLRGVALDLDHIDTPVRVRPNSYELALRDALRQADIVILANGYDTAIKCSDEQALQINGPIMYNFAFKVASICPDAFICIVTPPINSIVPLFSEVMKRCRVYDPNKIFGVCSLTEMRANTIVADYLSLDPTMLNVPMIGGMSFRTSVPLFSHAQPFNEFTEDDIHNLTSAILDIPKECQKLKTSAPLSTAYATMRFVLTLAAGVCCCDYAKQTAFVRSDVLPQVKYFASSIKFGAKGAILNYGLPKLNDYELEMLENAIPALERDIEQGVLLYEQLCAEQFKEEIMEALLPKKPFLEKTPCPPCPCLPTEVCQPRLPEHPCRPAS
ncbi:UNVERIFIED_CONTAM: hypothetical protein PYX00_002699 [Menopon gallinae]|uniref:Malate dehydrogenase, mitochondrial n=1 Tax=Menopon gallinae TaxID=328185 RepID=A0AAW2HXT0_9NEOP